MQPSAGSTSRTSSGASGTDKGRRASADEVPSYDKRVVDQANSKPEAGVIRSRKHRDRGVPSTSPAQVSEASGAPSAGVPVPMSNYAFFVKYTYSNECALLAYNFHALVSKLGVYEQVPYRRDHRLISVTLAYIFYRYQVHHCDMALDLAVTLVYLEDAINTGQIAKLEPAKDEALNLICYLAFLAHAFNADRTIRLSDWYKEIGWHYFGSCQQLNGYVFKLFSQVRKYKLRVNEKHVKHYIQKLCRVPSQIHDET